MTRTVCALGLLVALGGSASADEGRPMQVGGVLGYAFPAGLLERGSRTADVTFGAPFVAFDGAYRIAGAWSVGAAFSYGVAIPKLCATSSDCTSSLGHDETLMLLGRWHIGQWGPFAPTVDARLGYEWLGTSLSDNGVTSVRRYRGFAGALAADAMFDVSSRIAVGLRTELRGGVFHRAAVVASGVDQSGPTDGSTLHLWPVLGARAVVTF